MHSYAYVFYISTFELAILGAIDMRSVQEVPIFRFLAWLGPVHGLSFIYCVLLFV